MATFSRKVDTSSSDEGLSEAFRIAGILDQLKKEITPPEGKRVRFTTLSQFYMAFDTADVQNSAETIVNATSLKWSSPSSETC